MPLTIIRHDITMLRVDAIVNTTNEHMIPDGGADAAIHAKAGAELSDECRLLAPLAEGEAKLTAGYGLLAKYVIHTRCPLWQGGEAGEVKALSLTYKNALAVAAEHKCESVAFPLIASGLLGFPTALALSVAADTITEFLDRHEMLVYLVVFDKSSFEISEELFSDIKTYVDDNYVNAAMSFDDRARRRRECDAPMYYSRRKRDFGISSMESSLSDVSEDAFLSESLEDMLSHLDDPFSVTLLKLIDAKGMSDVECYKRSNVSKNTFWKIVNQAGYRPSKNTVLAFSIGLRLSLEETESLLSTVGFTLSGSSKFDVIIKYFIINKRYDIFEINEALFKFDQELLGC